MCQKLIIVKETFPTKVTHRVRKIGNGFLLLVFRIGVSPTKRGNMVCEGVLSVEYLFMSKDLFAPNAQVAVAGGSHEKLE